MNKIADGSVDMILCDLPYGTTACAWDHVIPFEPLWGHYWRVLKPNGAIVLFGSQPFTSILNCSCLKEYRYEMIWVKNRTTGIFLVNKMPLKNHETISVFYRTLPTYNPQKEIALKKSTGHKYSYSVKEKEKTGISPQLPKPACNYEPDKLNPKSVLLASNDNLNTNFHPCQKPIALLEYLIKTYTNEGEVVLDNCMGSGSSGVAAVNTRRQFIGIETDDKYFEIAKGRIKVALSLRPQKIAWQ
jgi:site-specific DNA-methyltransferase (adenine-specific)